MSKLLSSVLDKVSENNNEYREELKELNKKIDEKTTTLVGDVVTLSNYTVDFSNAVTSAKEKLVVPISRVVESYVIKDLRSVETVNEQFIDKINDKMETANITSKEEKDNFIDSLNTLLNDKYLEIVRIKRVDFISLDGTNVEVEKLVLDFNEHLKQTFNFSSEKLDEVLNTYKKDIYSIILDTLSKISNLYLNNFVSEVSSALSATIDFDDTIIRNDDDFKPYIPEIPAIPEVEVSSALDVPEVPIISNESDIPNVLDIPEVPSFEAESAPLNTESFVTYEQNEQTDSLVSSNFISEDINDEQDEVKPMEMPSIIPITPIEVKEEKEISRKTYDVEEILKIAKSPVVTMPSEAQKNSSNDYLNVDTIKKEEEKEFVNTEFDEKEIVEEMIRRLTKRLEAINERQTLYEQELSKIEDDEIFVNDLIENSNSKKQELDKFEEELDKKETELKEKQIELDKKLNDVLPFANAIMKEDKKEA